MAAGARTSSRPLQRHSGLRPDKSPVVLCVAEKPSLASSIANFLSDGTHATRRGSQDVHEFRREFKGQLCDFRVTAVLGHVLTIDFPSKFQSWDLDPGVLFDAPVQKKEASPGARVVEHLEREAKGAAHLILWLDCDREGENICFEVMDACVPVMRPPPGAARDAHVHRAKFSAVTKRSIEDAMRSLGKPNRDEALAVDARQELDLKIGVAFTRFQTRFFRKVRRLRQQRRLLRSVPDAHSRIRSRATPPRLPRTSPRITGPWRWS